MSGTITVDVTMTLAVKDRLDAPARETQRERGSLISIALERFLSLEEKHLGMIREAIVHADAHPEDMIADEAVAEWLDSLDTDTELPANAGLRMNTQED